MKTKTILAAALLIGLAFTTVRAADVTPAEARVIAKEAYIYGEPIVDNYRVQYAYFVDTKSPEYKAPWNHIWNGERLFSPEDKEANWLPAPKGPFAMYMRLYWPKEEALEGKWTAPKLNKAQ